MYRVLFQLFAIFNLLVVTLTADNDVTNFDDKHPYDIQRLHRNFLSSLSLKDALLSLTKDVHLNTFNREFSLKSFENLSQNTSKCVNDILYTFQSVSNSSNQWSWQILDSFAKPPESGILIGNVRWFGEYNECIKVYAPPKASGSKIGNFHGQYCSLAYNLPLQNKSIPLTFGICLPDSCSPNDLQTEIADLLIKAGGYPVSNGEQSVSNSSTTITCRPRERHLTAAAKSVIALISIFCALALAGSSITVFKYFKELLQEEKRSSLFINISDRQHILTEGQDLPKGIGKSDDAVLEQNEGSNGLLDNCALFLNCFCVFTNGAKLLNTDSSEGQLLCIHGIRFLSMSWVILGHAYLFGAQETRNLMEVGDIMNDFSFQVVLQGFYSVDSFFVLSGFLLTYLSMTEFSKTEGSINWLYFYIHRYIRLTPIYLVVLGFSATVFLYLGSGPLWPMFDTDPNCVKHWWWNLLYLNNFIPMTEQCLGWSWYLANDMQFFIISPIFLISLWRWPKVGYSLLVLFLAVCMLSNFVLTYHYDLLIGFVGLGGTTMEMNANLQPKFNEYFKLLYIKPYARIGPYLAGIIAGYIFFKHKVNNKPKLSWLYLAIGWIVASAASLTVVYGLYKSNPSLIARSFYNACNRTCFGFGLAWVIYVCLTNQSDVINRILSYKFFIPLSRLTYSTYLIHPLIITGYYTALKRPVEFSHPTVVLLFFSFMVVSYAVAFPVSLILESPIVSMEKMIRNKFRRQKM